MRTAINWIKNETVMVTRPAFEEWGDRLPGQSQPIYFIFVHLNGKTGEAKR